MTDLEQASLEAFNDLVTHGGKVLTVGGQAVQGIVQLIEPQNARYTLEDGEGQDAIVQVLKSEWPTGKNRVGTTFAITGDLNFRIKSARTDTQFWWFRCEVTDV